MKNLNSQNNNLNSSMFDLSVLNSNSNSTQSSSSNSVSKESMPDVTKAQKSKIHIPLDWVGMGEVETSIKYNSDNTTHNLPAKANIYVNLIDPDAKGIHMSRIYLLATQELENKSATALNIKSLLKEMVFTQEGRSNKAKIQLHFELPIKRKALISDLKGLRHYPISINWELDSHGELSQILELEVMYSSTCPCSAALARQLIKNKWLTDFGSQKQISIDDVAYWLEQEQSIVATPHAQRSNASVRLKINNTLDLDYIKYIDLLENTLKTPVQTAVKREDEQEFARLNGSNLMFCEDAAREIYSALQKDQGIQDFWLRVEHLESLHSHNAVSETSKFGKKI